MILIPFNFFKPNISFCGLYLYNIECDRCGDKLDPEFWHDDVSSLEYIMPDCHWIEYNGKHYCPDCYEIDDDDNIVIKD